MKLTDPTLDLPFAIVQRVGPVPGVFKFPLAPQRVRVSLPARNAIHQTLTSNYLDDFSGPRAVLAHVQLQGTFGYHPTVGAIGLAVHGSIHLKVFEVIFETFNALDRQLKKNFGAAQEYLGLSRAHAWRIAIKEFSYEIRHDNPLLYFYSIQFDRLEDYLSPVGPSLPGLTPGTSIPVADVLRGLF